MRCVAARRAPCCRYDWLGRDAQPTAFCDEPHDFLIGRPGKVTAYSFRSEGGGHVERLEAESAGRWKSIVVDLSSQSVEAIEGAARVFRFDCVTGDSEHPTDRGAFRIMEKYRSYRSRAYNVQMDYAMFFTGDGKALHQYHGPMPLSLVRMARNTVSHGCVRLAEADAKRLYDWAPMGTVVQVS
ncbi:L,D-transpeptidase [Burkholderia ubonensis]|nr:L,D-transpeptidase [Burkholderia ubonensis]RQP99201.1 murein L,D-transpeptidase [Burkholderia ubonensis]